MREKYETLALADLKAIAKGRGIKGTSTMKKEDVINAMVELDAQESEQEKQQEARDKEKEAVISELDSGETAYGILEIISEFSSYINGDNVI